MIDRDEKPMLTPLRPASDAGFRDGVSIGLLSPWSGVRFTPGPPPRISSGVCALRPHQNQTKKYLPTRSAGP
jgi:hypothetical protein